MPEYVNQYVSGTRPPTTAWPRRTRPSAGTVVVVVCSGCSGTFFALMLVRPGVVVQCGVGLYDVWLLCGGGVRCGVTWCVIYKVVCVSAMSVWCGDVWLLNFGVVQ